MKIKNNEKIMNKAENHENFDEEPPEGFKEAVNFSPEELDRLFEMAGDHHPGNEPKKEIRITWNPYEMFSSQFLYKHYELVLCHILHHIKAFLLFPADCLCEKQCLCHESREKIIFSLNTACYNRLYPIIETSNSLHAIKALWNLPEDHKYRELHTSAYSLCFVEKELKSREERGDFEIINQLVWTFLRLGQTSKVCLMTTEVSFSDAVEMIAGGMPVKVKADRLKKSEPLRGEKTYGALFKRYQSICHFIAALAFCKKEDPRWDNLSECLYPPLECMERFLNVAHWFRKNLLLLERRNVKGKVFLREEELCPLPDWIQIQEIDLPIEPFQDKVKEILSNVQYIDPVTKVVKMVNLYEEMFPSST